MTSSHNHQQCIQQALQHAHALADQQSIRLTPLREQVLRLIWASHQPVKAYDILNQLSQGEHLAKPPTVYRCLDFLLEHGLIHRLHSLNAYIGCSHPQAHEDCYFLICHQCGELSEYCDPQLKNHLDKTLGAAEFQMHKTNLEIEGICKHCQTRPHPEQ